MQVMADQWTPLFESLAQKVSSAGRTQLLTTMIEEVKVSCLSNFGEWANGDMRPWNEELLLSKSYALLINRNFATLERTEEERDVCKDTEWEGGTGAHLKDSFFSYGGSDSMALVNICEYASNHQNGEGVPRRAFFPVDESGELMPFMEARLFELADAHFQV